MTIKTDVPAAEADALAAERKGRVLERRSTADGVVCDVEVLDAAEPEVASEEPKKRGRPPKASKG